MLSQWGSPRRDSNSSGSSQSNPTVFRQIRPFANSKDQGKKWDANDRKEARISQEHVLFLLISFAPCRSEKGATKFAPQRSKNCDATKNLNQAVRASAPDQVFVPRKSDNRTIFGSVPTPTSFPA